MQLVLPWFGRVPRAPRPESVLVVDDETYPVTITRHRRARRFVLRMTADGALRLTVPRGASIAGGLAFAKGQGRWIAREAARRAERAGPWGTGTLIWFRGLQVPLAVSQARVAFAVESVALPDGVVNVRDAIEAHLRRRAAAELPPRCLDLARLHGLTVSRVSIRNQRSRWGSCSSRGAIALNWRLIQMPPEVSDYVILHELMHLKQPNHSRQFWREVEAVCDGWRAAEQWLRTHGRELL
jgi:predicted metal-dependent hydrolase